MDQRTIEDFERVKRTEFYWACSMRGQSGHGKLALARMSSRCRASEGVYTGPYWGLVSGRACSKDVPGSDLF